MEETDTEFVSRHAETLHGLATQFVERDWICNSDTGSLSAIRYDDPRDRLWGRVKEAARWLFRKQSPWMKEIGGPGRFAMAAHVLRRDKHLPDCQLDNGNVIVYWVETGWYLQSVQPKVGALFADWMAAEPESPYALAIAREIQRIDDVTSASSASS